MNESKTIPPYILGIWLGDKYWWSSSIGLTNINPNLIQQFIEFFKNIGFENDRIKLSVYTLNGNSEKEILSEKFQIPIGNIKPYKFKKGKKTIFIVYVNSRPLKRIFIEHEKKLEDLINTGNIFQFIAGRFDADGNLEKDKNRIRIGYTTKGEVERDAQIISRNLKMEPKISFYKSSNEWILEMCGKQWKNVIDKILEFSKRGDVLAEGHRQLVS